jgi:thioredoxin 1
MANHIESLPQFNALVAASAVLAVDVSDLAVEASTVFSGHVDALAAKLPAVNWARADLARLPEFKAIFGIEAAPALLLFRESIGLYAGPAIFPPAKFEALVRRALTLDMDEVRRDLQAQRLAESGLATHLVCPTARRGGLESA